MIVQDAKTFAIAIVVAAVIAFVGYARHMYKNRDQ